MRTLQTLHQLRKLFVAKLFRNLPLKRSTHRRVQLRLDRGKQRILGIRTKYRHQTVPARAAKVDDLLNRILGRILQATLDLSNLAPGSCNIGNRSDHIFETFVVKIRLAVDGSKNLDITDGPHRRSVRAKRDQILPAMTQYRIIGLLEHVQFTHRYAF